MRVSFINSVYQKLTDAFNATDIVKEGGGVVLSGSRTEIYTYNSANNSDIFFTPRGTSGTVNRYAFPHLNSGIFEQGFMIKNGLNTSLAYLYFTIFANDGLKQSDYFLQISTAIPPGGIVYVFSEKSENIVTGAGSDFCRIYSTPELRLPVPNIRMIYTTTGTASTGGVEVTCFRRY